MYEYHQASTALLDQIVEANKKVLPKAIAWMAKTKMFKSWSMTTILGVTGLLMVMLLSLWV